MDKIITQDVYIKPDSVREGLFYDESFNNMLRDGYLYKSTAMIVLTVEQFNKIIKEKEDEAWNDGWNRGNKGNKQPYNPNLNP